MKIVSRVRKRLATRSSQVDIVLNQSINNTPRCTFLGDQEAIRGRRNLNPRKVTKRTRITHEELVTQTILKKRQCTDDHVINIKKCQSKGRKANKDRRTMITCQIVGSSDHSGEALQPSKRCLLKAIKKVRKTTNHFFRNGASPVSASIDAYGRFY
jgi:hypothetical protein